MPAQRAGALDPKKPAQRPVSLSAPSAGSPHTVRKTSVSGHQRPTTTTERIARKSTPNGGGVSGRARGAADTQVRGQKRRDRDEPRSTYQQSYWWLQSDMASHAWGRAVEACRADLLGHTDGSRRRLNLTNNRSSPPPQMNVGQHAQDGLGHHSVRLHARRQPAGRGGTRRAPAALDGQRPLQASATRPRPSHRRS